MKFVVAALMLLLAGMPYASAVTAAQVGTDLRDNRVVIDEKGEKYSIKKEKLPYFRELETLLHKEVLTNQDYDRAKTLLEKLTNSKISADEWRAIRGYIDEEHKKWLFFEKRKSMKRSLQSKGLVSGGRISTQSLSSSDYLPIFLQPWVDINGRLFPYFEGSNDLIKVYHFYWSSTGEIEITAVFRDEDHPIWDTEYDLIRLAQNGRIEDIETFFINVDSSGNPQSISFNYGGTGTYSGTQQFFVLFPDHISETVQASEFSWSGTRPHVYINTWNHLFGEDDNNRDLSDKTWTTYTSAEGTRADAEEDF